MTVTDSVASQITAKEAALESEIEEQIHRAAIPDEAALTYLIDKIRKRRAILTVKPEFTPEVVGIAKQIIAFGGAGFGFILAFSERIPYELGAFTIAIATLYVNLTLVSMAILIWFFVQARTRYPWLYLERLGNSDQYFYYNAISADYSYQPIFFGKKDKSLGTALSKYLDNLSKFTARSVNESKRNELKNELIQYHLLIFYQGYLDQYEQQLTHTALYGFGASILSALVMFVLNESGVFP